MLNHTNFIKSRIAYLAVILVSVSFLYIPARGQHFVTREFDQHLTRGKSTADSIYKIETSASTTGIVAKIDVIDIFNGAFIIVQEDTLYLNPDEDGDRSDLSIYSNLMTFSPPIREFLFFPGNIMGPVTFYFIDAKSTKLTSQPAKVKKKSDVCSAPEMIEQSVWREGLDDPDYERIPNKVQNIIIHHSAGSNSDTDYINVVRNIYIYHVEIREWSDIGYNYLVAQDGIIFNGRDPGELEQDEVLGAHFCNSNSGTLGICMMGTYSELTPTDEAIQSLIELITWKSGKDSLNPMGAYPHPLNQNLPVIAGHRDGCSTECPGDSLYDLLGFVRNKVMSAFENCGYYIKPLSVDPIEEQDIIICYRVGEITVHFNEPGLDLFQIYDILGRKRSVDITFLTSGELIISTNKLASGIYYLKFRKSGSIQASKITVY